MMLKTLVLFYAIVRLPLHLAGVSPLFLWINFVGAYIILSSVDDFISCREVEHKATYYCMKRKT